LQEAQRSAIVDLLSERLTAWLKERMMNPDRIRMSPGRRLMEEIRAQAKQEALLVLLGARGLRMTAEQRAVIERCVDTTTLNGWVVKAATATSVGEVLAAEKKPRTKRPTARTPKGPSSPTKRRAARRGTG
jgi:hypothetical protein